MAMITNDWLTALGGEFHKPYYRQLFEFVKNEYNTTVVFPPADDIYNAFHLTPLSKVKVVILGQDPYHNVGQAHGLCFSVKPDVEIPPSLVNIYQELHDDLGCYIPNNGYLDLQNFRFRASVPYRTPSFFIASAIFSALAGVISVSGRRRGPAAKPIRLTAFLTGIGLTSEKRHSNSSSVSS